jgi:hypothetical protein
MNLGRYFEIDVSKKYYLIYEMIIQVYPDPSPHLHNLGYK